MISLKITVSETNTKGVNSVIVGRPYTCNYVELFMFITLIIQVCPDIEMRKKWYIIITSSESAESLPESWLSDLHSCGDEGSGTI